MASPVFNTLLICACMNLAAAYEISDGYDKCKVDTDCWSKACNNSDVAVCDAPNEECMCVTTGGGNCEFVACQNGAGCVSKESGFKCVCPHGFKGDLCQTDKCDDVNCNNGACVHDDMTTEGFKCECQDGWTGEMCDEEDKDLCQYVTCANDGQCENTLEDPGFHCVCPVGGTKGGLFCEEETGPKIRTCTVDSDCNTECEAGKEAFCRVPDFTCGCKSESSISCTSHHHCAAHCEGTNKLGLCMADGLCDCFHGLPNYFAHMIINKFPNSPPFADSVDGYPAPA